MSVFLTVLLAGIVTDNLVLSKLLGFDESNKAQNMLDVVKKGGLITGLLLLSTAASYPVIKYLLLPFELGYLMTFVSVLVICGILALALLLSKKFLPSVYGFLSANRSVLTCSAAVLGVCLTCFNSESVTNYLTALVFALASGIGFTLVSFIFFAVRERMKTADIPEIVKGLPLTLVTAALLSMAMGGFA